MNSVSRDTLIKNPRSILLFPEGTRTPDGQLGLFKRGGLMLSIDTGLPIVPVAYVGTFETLKKGARSVRNIIIPIAERKNWLESLLRSKKEK